MPREEEENQPRPSSQPILMGSEAKILMVVSSWTSPEAAHTSSSPSLSTYSCLVLRSSSLFFWNMSRQCPVSSALSSSSRCRFLTTVLIFCLSDSRLA